MQGRNDTPPEVADLVRKSLMARPGHERMLMGSRMFDAARAVVMASFPPGLSDFEVKVRLCERIYGDEVNLAGFAACLCDLRVVTAKEAKDEPVNGR